MYGTTTGILLRSAGHLALAATTALMVSTAAVAQELPEAGQPQEQRTQLLRAMATALDAEAMARDAAGPYWERMSLSERSRYVDIFRRHVIAVIGDLLPQHLPESSGQPTRLKLAGGDTLARLSVDINGQQVPVAIRLRDEEKIVDLLIGSVSLVATKRSEITSLAGRDGVAVMLEALAHKSGGVAIEIPTGGSTAPSVAAAPQPPQSEPAALASRQVVYFRYGSAAVPPEARSLLVELARGAWGPAVVKVTGYADPTGSHDYNSALSRQRAEDVARELVAAGVSREKIQVEARGEVPPVAEPVSGAERRRVEIVVSPTT
jgi:outer membrane protein OmpA-like peptidoglycan-associated protein